jgi:hypothetical protein
MNGGHENPIVFQVVEKKCDLGTRQIPQRDSKINKEPMFKPKNWRNFWKCFFKYKFETKISNSLVKKIAKFFIS